MEKVDLPLQGLLEQRARSFADARNRGDAAAKAAAKEIISVKVYYEGSFEPVAALGFQLHEDVEGVASGALTPDQIRKLAAVASVRMVMLPPKAGQLLDKSVPEILANQAWAVAAASGDLTANKGRGVLVAVIDSGIDVFHGAFRHADGTTRIRFLWDQTFRFNAAGQPLDSQGQALTGPDIPLDEAGAPLTTARTPVALHPAFPAALNYGAEFTAAQINAALTAHPDGENLPRSLRDEPSQGGTHHGTHVAGIAAGNGAMNDKCTAPGTYIGVAPEADLVIVKTGFTDRQIQRVPDAVRYCFNIANLLSPATGDKKACVVNISIGGHFGPHNGLEEDCRTFDTLTAGILGIGRAIVFGAGNDRNKDLHAAFTIAPGGTRTLRVNLTKNDAKLFSCFASYNENTQLTCRIRLPASGAARQGSARDVRLSNAAEVVADHNLQVFGHLQAPADLDRHFVTQVTRPNSAIIETGVWELELAVPAAAANPAHVHVWNYAPAGWDATMLPNAGEPQSPTDADRDVKRPPDWIRATLTNYGACRSAISVAAYNAEETDTPLAPFSGQGPSPNELDFGLYNPAHALAKPDIAAPGMAIDAPRGMARRCCLECDCCVDRYVAEQGTSMAAPHVTGVVALMLAQNPRLTAAEIKTMLRANVRPPPPGPAGGPPAAEVWGAGKVDALDSVAAAIAAIRGRLPEEVLAPLPQPLPAPARPLSIPERLQDWTRAFGERPAWNLFAALVSLHVDEVKRLIDTNWRVGTVWQRYGGPRLVRSLVLAPAPQDPPVPAALGGPEPRELFRRLAVILLRYGSPALKADIEAYRPLLDALPGASWDELDSLASAGPVP